MVKRREDLTEPRGTRRIGVQYEPEAFGRFAEAIARNLGTARFLVIQTIIVVVWITFNVAAVALRWDPYPFILLNLAFSTQAAYAAPLILLAQNRQEARDRAQAEVDRNVAERTQADTEFLAREIAGVRVMLADVVTGEELREQLDGVVNALDLVTKRLDEIAGRQAASGDGGTSTAELG
jgi:uncharacterized membrane protein